MTLQFMLREGYSWRGVCDHFGWTTLELRTNIHALAKDLRARNRRQDITPNKARLYYEVNQ